MKKIISLVLVVFVLVLSFAGCAENETKEIEDVTRAETDVSEDDGKNTEESTEEKVTISEKDCKFLNKL